MLADMMDGAIGSDSDLAEIVQEKTLGNPGSVQSFLQGAHDAETLRFEPGAHRWTWDSATLRAQPVCQSVLDWMVAAVQELPTGTQRVLGLAACLGEQFDLGKLALAADAHPTAGLRAAPTGTNFATRNPQMRAQRPAQLAVPWPFSTLEFVKASSRLLTSQERERAHLDFGRELLTQLRDGEPEASLVETLEHLNRTRSTAPEDSSLLVDLNLRAAGRTAAACRFREGLRFFEAAERFLGPHSWEEDLPRALEAEIGIASCLYRLQDSTSGSKRFRLLLSRCVEPADRGNGV